MGRVGTILVVLLSVLVGCSSPYSALFWQTSSPQEIRVLVASGYEGPVLIIWQVPNGGTATTTDEAFIYRLQPDGALLLQDDPPRSVGQWSFWHEEADGRLVPIPSSTCFNDAPEQGVVVCTGMSAASSNSKEVRPNVSFAITTLARKEEMVDRIFDELYPKYDEQLQASP